MPRSIRNNATHVGLWRSTNTKELKVISEEMAGEVSPEKFLQVYEFIMSDPSNHSMMFIDLHKKPNHPSMFRKNYTQFVIDVQFKVMSEIEEPKGPEEPVVEPKEEIKSKSGRSVRSEKQLAVLAEARVRALSTIKKNAEKRKQ